MIKRWSVKHPSAEEQTLISTLSHELNSNDVLARLLVYRNINDYETARQYFNPQLSDLHDPFLMKHMKKSVKRINKALGNKEKILVYGDYDVDGITAVAVVYTLLRKFTKNLEYYIPDRDSEGYGISLQGVDYAEANGFSLIISLDCGIKASNQVLYAKEKGIDFIITDHHNPAEKLPKAKAVLDPKRLDCKYPYKELSGCGVGFKLMQAFCQSNGLDFDHISHCLDLVAVSIASDIVPITGENRILAHYGMKQLMSKPRLGLRTILESANMLNKDISISDIVFKVGPRLNASGRVCSAKEAVKLLIATDYDDAQRKCAEINEYNLTRRDLDKNITEEALIALSLVEDLEDKKSTVLYNPNWHKGVIGIVASRLIEKHHRPTIILTLSNGLVTGSARSVPGFDLYSAVLSCKDLLETFGGHKYAAGLNLKEENVPELKRRFEEYVAAHITEKQLIPTLDIDAEIELKTITGSFVSILKRMRPFGPENMKPLFVTRRLRDSGNSSLVGVGGDHIRLSLKDEKGRSINAIAFNQAKHFEKINSGELFDICYNVEENTFKERTSIQLMIKDIKASGLNE
ncbi:MAG: single-stranded-DNA-specific exonuclease RecJ [Bacteroidales bacterium]|jgi:single-stranded-DNA-specific exonuclease|nr:single-stranded-DNA-specific exonuclease RecJ [Bacteroidales bacterium]